MKHIREVHLKEQCTPALSACGGRIECVAGSETYVHDAQPYASSQPELGWTLPRPDARHIECPYRGDRTTQWQLAEQLGIDSATIRGLETGLHQPSRKKRELIAVSFR